MPAMLASPLNSGDTPNPLERQPAPTDPPRSQYVWPWTLRDGTPILIRPIEPEDEPLMVSFHATLSDQSVYMRYFHQIALSQRISHERLLRVCHNDYAREIALVAVRPGYAGGAPAILGVGRLIKLPHDMAEFALLVSDGCQRSGLGSALLDRLVAVGRAEGIRRIVAEVLPENSGMIQICRRFGFRISRALIEVVQVQLDL